MSAQCEGWCGPRGRNHEGPVRQVQFTRAPAGYKGASGKPGAKAWYCEVAIRDDRRAGFGLRVIRKA